jgi:hypothetical protein
VIVDQTTTVKLEKRPRVIEPVTLGLTKEVATQLLLIRVSRLRVVELVVEVLQAQQKQQELETHKEMLQKIRAEQQTAEK